MVVACSVLDAAEHWQPSWPATVREAARLWKRYNLAIIEGCDGVPPASYLRMHYESLLRNTAAELRRAIAFIGAEVPDETTLGAVVDANRFSVLRVKHADWRNGRFFRCGTSGEWAARFSKSDIRDFNEEAGDLLADFGYS